ncbi:MAG: extracellular solute-binding protein [Spirochaetia bacterium]|nr:extracellular solute-binding protein [Spirochaetia bacterium]
MKKTLIFMLLIIISCNGLLFSQGEKEKEVVEIDFISWAPYTDEFFDLFYQQYPNIKVNYQQVPAGNYSQIITTRLATNDIDIAGIRAENYKDFVESGYLLDLSDYKWMDNYFDWALQDVTESNGAIYSMPMGIFAEAVWYNKSLFEELEITVPKTLTEWYEVCEVLLEEGYTPIIGGNSAKWTNGFTALPFIQPIVANDPQLASKLLNKEISFTDPQFIDVLKQSKAMIEKGYIGKDSLALDPSQAMGLMIQGKAAMMIQGTWFVNGFKGVEVPFELDVFNLPTYEGEKQYSAQIQGIKTAVMANSNKLDAALKFAQFLSDPSLGASKYYNDIGHFPTVKGVTVDEPLLALWEPVINNEGFVSFRDQLPVKAQSAYFTGLQELFLDKDIEQIAQDIQKGFE